MKRHRLDIFALCAGAFFVALAVGFALDAIDAWDMNVAWVGPALLIALGLGGVLAAIGRATAPDPPEPEPATDVAT
jgi:hypothetical protein